MSNSAVPFGSVTTSDSIGIGVPVASKRSRLNATARSVPAATYTRWPLGT